LPATNKLVAAVEALTGYSFGSFYADLRSRRLYRHGQAASLPPKAWIVLLRLLEGGGKCISSDDLLECLAPDAGEIGPENVTHYIAVLRNVLGDDRRRSVFISTEYGRGYRFIVPTQRHVRSEPEPPSTQLLEARFRLERRRDLRTALGQFLAIARLRPCEAEGHVGVAEASVVLGSHLLESPTTAFARAARYVRKAQRLQPDLARAHSVLAMIALFSQHDADGAEGHCERALALDSRDVLAIRVMSRISFVRENWSQALHYLRKEIRIRGDSLDALVMLAVAEQYQGRPTTAAHRLQSICSLDPTYLQSQYYLGGCLVEAGHPSEAVNVLHRLIKRDRSPQNLSALGRAYASDGKRAAARGMLKELYARRTREYVSSYLLCTVHAAVGERREAQQRMQDAYRCRDPWAIFFPIERRFDAVRL
jgi:DNA-binding winged helix-turn-helix (wHTH) protein/Tfp pilus assembly protein PilF